MLSKAMFESCLQKQEAIKTLFKECTTPEAKYQKIIELGRESLPFPENEKLPCNLVEGCQSTLYLHSSWSEDRLIFETASDALISSGLAALLVKVYSGETPETILKCPPDYLQDLEIGMHLTPNRANGLYNIHLRMKQEAVKKIVERDAKKSGS